MNLHNALAIQMWLLEYKVLQLFLSFGISEQGDRALSQFQLFFSLSLLVTLSMVCKWRSPVDGWIDCTTTLPDQIFSILDCDRNVRVCLEVLCRQGELLVCLLLGFNAFVLLS